MNETRQLQRLQQQYDKLVIMNTARNAKIASIKAEKEKWKPDKWKPDRHVVEVPSILVRIMRHIQDRMDRLQARINRR